LGCAVSARDKTQEVSFSSNVEGASLYLNGHFYGPMPRTVKLLRDADYTAMAKAPGFAPKGTTLAHGYSWGFLIVDAVCFSLLLDPIIGIVAVCVDASSAEIKTLPDEVALDLAPSTAAPSDPETIKIELRGPGR
jgi:hypothetical protein